MTAPYTYLVTCIPTGERYYGVRYARGCKPEELWNTYFTSSAKVAKRLAVFGASAFSVEIRKTFDNGFAARCWEDKVLRRLRVKDKPMWLNQSYGMAFPSRSTRTGIKQVYLYSDQSYKWYERAFADAIVAAGLGELRGPPKPAGHIHNVSLALKGKPKSSSHVQANIASRKKNPKSRGWTVYTNGITNVNIYPGDLIPNGFAPGSCNKGKTIPNSVKGKTYEEIYGSARAEELKQVRRQALQTNNPGHKMKGRTYEEMYGVDKAERLKLTRSVGGKKNSKIYEIYHNNSSVFVGSRLEAAHYLYHQFGGSKAHNLYDMQWLAQRNIKVDIQYKSR